ncbi:MAG: ECF-type sigma factor [Vicinamibacterales bacterium]
MPAPGISPVAVTELLNRSRLGNVDALDTLTPILYAELRRIAGGYLRRERPGQTLQARRRPSSTRPTCGCSRTRTSRLRTGPISSA